jgi:hypothetical protein
MRWRALGFVLVACGGNGNGADGGTDAASDAPDVALACGTSAWTTYGYDAHRTSASDGCVMGPLAVAWRYTPSAAPWDDGGTRQPLSVDHAVAQSDAVFLTWGAQNYIGTTPAGTTQSLDRIDPQTGKAIWSFVPVFGDASTSGWATLGLGGVLYDSDGLYWIDAATGAQAHVYSVDYWGDVLTDSTQAYATNTMYVDGPPMFVGAYDTTGTQVWQKNVFGVTKHGDYDGDGALALDGGTLFFAPRYGSSVTLTSGLYAFDPATGNQKWLQPTSPTSDIAATGGMVFLSEGTSLVARNESDGSIAWTSSWASPVDGATGAAPVVTPSLVVVQEKSGIVAHARATGKIVWTAPLTPTSDTGITTLHCDAVLAAALGSSTLVAVDATTVHVFDLGDGHEVWSGALPGLVGVRLTSPVIVGTRVYVIDRAPIEQLNVKTPGALLALE